MSVFASRWAKVVERSEAGLLLRAVTSLRFGLSQPPHLMATLNQTGGHGRAHSTGMKDGQHASIMSWVSRRCLRSILRGAPCGCRGLPAVEAFLG